MVLEWSRQYDTIIMDSAPLLSVSDTMPVASWVDVVIVVVRVGLTPLKAIQRSRAVLRRAGARVAGFLLNDFTDQIGEHGYGYYGKGDNGYYN
jgi:Mrp family chromosome partitioning ATPase